ncbi:putative efflux protein MATE family [Firmicutes bacterium CAG:882]|nr:putative efflux protein MATE family [Firmicutes bacterium CAG:882]
MSENTKKNGIIEGTIWKQLLIFFFPILVGTFFQQLYNTVDAVVVGQFAGKEALSSVGGSSSQIINFVVGFFTGLSAGATVIISQFYGAGDAKKIHRALHTAYAFAIIGGIAAGLIGIAVTVPIMRLMNTPAELLHDSAMYVMIYFAGLVFIFVYNMGSAILRAIGDSKRPLYYLVICCGINIVLDILFVSVFKLGVLGAAVATFIAQFVSAIMVTRALMYHTEGMKLVLKEIRLHGDVLPSMLKIGLPTGIQSSMYSLSNIIVQSALNSFGVDTVAAWSAFGKIDSMYWMINTAFGIAATTFVGQNFGAGKYDRVKKGTMQCLLMDICAAVLFSTLALTFGGYMLRIFTSETEVINLGIRVMHVISPAYFIFVFIEILSGSLRAQGHVLVTTLMTMLGVCAFRVVWVLFIVPHGTLEQIVFCYPATWSVTATGMIIYYIYKQNKIIRKYNTVKR